MDDDTRFEVVVTGVKPGVEPRGIREGMGALTQSDPAGFDDFVARVTGDERLVVKDNLTGELARRYREALEQIGLLCEQRPMLSLVPLEDSSGGEVYHCPACNARQPVSGGEYDVCSECGVVRQRYEEVQAQKQMLDREHRKFRQGLEWEARQDEEQQALKSRRRRETAIRRMFEKMYGVDRLSRLRQSLVSRQGALAGAVLVLGAGGAIGAWYLSQQYFQEPAVAAAETDTAALPAAGVSETLEGSAPALQSGDRQVQPVVEAAQSLDLEAAVGELPAGSDTGMVPATAGPAPGVPVKADGSSAAVGGTDAASVETIASGGIGPAGDVAVLPGTLHPLDDPASADGHVGHTAGAEVATPDRTHARAAAILGTVAVDQAQAGNLDAARRHLEQARERLERIENPVLGNEVRQTIAYHRARTLAELGRRQALAGDIPAAQDSFVEALELIATLEAAAEQAAAYGFIARCLVEGGDELTAEEYFQQALSSADDAPRPLGRIIALVEVADQARLAGRNPLAGQLLSRAEEAVKALEQPLERALGLGLLARHRAALLDSNEVQPLFAEAAAAAQGVEDPDSRRRMMARLFAFQAQALATAVRQRRPDQEEQALEIAVTAWKRAFEVDDAQLRVLALSHVALGFAAAGDRERARQVFDQALEEVPET